MVTKLEFVPSINGSAFLRKRQDLGLSREELAKKLCITAKHILQIEEGGDSVFYSQLLKVQTARKLAALIELPNEEAFVEVVDFSVKSAPIKKAKPLEQEPILSSSFIQNTMLGLSSSIILITLLIAILYWYTREPLKTLYQETYLTPVQNIPEVSPEKESTVVQVPEEPPLPDPCFIPAELLVRTPAFSAPNASFKGNVLALASKTLQSVCVVDAKGVQQLIEVKPGQNNIVYGSSPFTLIAQDLSLISAYFQGWRVLPIQVGQRVIILKEVPLSPKPLSAVSPNSNPESNDQRVIENSSKPLTGNDDSLPKRDPE